MKNIALLLGDKGNNVILSQLAPTLDNYTFEAFGSVQEMVHQTSIRRLAFQRILISEAALTNPSKNLNDLLSFATQHYNDLDIVFIHNENLPEVTTTFQEVLPLAKYIAVAPPETNLLVLENYATRSVDELQSLYGYSSSPHQSSSGFQEPSFPEPFAPEPVSEWGNDPFAEDSGGMSLGSFGESHSETGFLSETAVPPTVVSQLPGPATSPVGHPQGFPQGLPKGLPKGLPLPPPQGAPLGPPQGAPLGPPQGAPLGSPLPPPQGVPLPPPQGLPLGSPQGTPLGSPLPPPQGAPLGGPPPQATLPSSFSTPLREVVRKPVQRRSPYHTPNPFLVCSGTPGSGYESLAVDEARRLAATGRSVLLIDLDASHTLLSSFSTGRLNSPIRERRPISEGSFDVLTNGRSGTPFNRDDFDAATDPALLSNYDTILYVVDLETMRYLENFIFAKTPQVFITTPGEYEDLQGLFKMLSNREINPGSLCRSLDSTKIIISDDSPSFQEDFDRLRNECFFDRIDWLEKVEA